MEVRSRRFVTLTSPYANLNLAVGNISGLVFYRLVSDRYLKHKAARSGITKPEYRLPPMLAGAITLPAGFFIYGWTAEYHIHWIVPLIGTALIGCSVVLTIVPTENYLVDVYNVYSTPAVAAGVILRAILGALFPLAGPSLYKDLGLGWGNTVLGFIAVAFIPALILLNAFWGANQKGTKVSIGVVAPMLEQVQSAASTRRHPLSIVSQSPTLIFESPLQTLG